MDKNIKILLIIILLLLLYDNIELLCNSYYLIEGEEVEPTGTTDPTGTVNFLDTDMNTFKYSNNTSNDDYLLDRINSPNYDGGGLTLISSASNTELCNLQFPDDPDDPKKYEITVNGKTRNLKEECLAGMTKQKMACLLEDTNPEHIVNNKPISYYSYDPKRKKCVYNPPSYLTTRRYCNSYDNKTECLANKTKDDQTNHCNWVKSFRYYPNPGDDDILNCNNQSNETDCINAVDNRGYKRCSWNPNETVKAGEDDVGTCYADPSKYLGGVSFENVKLDGNPDVIIEDDKNVINVSGTNRNDIYRYIQDGACMENCSTSNASECNNRLNCFWVENARDNLLTGFDPTGDYDVENIISGGMCMNNEILLEKQDKEIYDQTKMCSHFENDQNKCNSYDDKTNNDRVNDDTWHCKWKKFAGSCLENSSNTKDTDNNINTLSFDGYFYRLPGVDACQTKFYDGLKTNINACDTLKDIYINSDSRGQAGIEYDYLVNNAGSAENICKSIRYNASEIKTYPFNQQANESQASNASFCEWRDPPPETCHYKSSTDLVNPGNYYLKTDSGSEEAVGRFNRRDPAYYYNSMFVPLCNHLNETECGNADINCTWNASDNKCKAKCIGIGSNVNRCGKTPEELKDRVKQKYNKSPNVSGEENIDTILSNTLFDDYSHCTFNDDLNVCVLDSDYTSWQAGGVWSTEIPTTIYN